MTRPDRQIPLPQQVLDSRKESEVPYHPQQERKCPTLTGVPTLKPITEGEQRESQVMVLVLTPGWMIQARTQSLLLGLQNPLDDQKSVSHLRIV
jgi:hypothetical protein